MTEELAFYPNVDLGQVVRQYDLIRHHGQFYSHTGDGVTERFCDTPTMTFKKEPFDAKTNPVMHLWRRIE